MLFKMGINNRKLLLIAELNKTVALVVSHAWPELSNNIALSSSLDFGIEVSKYHCYFSLLC